MKNCRNLVLAGIIPVILLLINGCSSSYSGKTYTNTDSSKYIRFLNSNTLEWKWSDKLRPEEFEYTIEDKKIRTVRKLFGMGQIKYIEIIDEDKLKDPEGDIYSIK